MVIYWFFGFKSTLWDTTDQQMMIFFWNPTRNCCLFLCVRIFPDGYIYIFFFFVAGQRNTKRYIIFHKEVHIYIYIEILCKPGSPMNILGSRCSENPEILQGIQKIEKQVWTRTNTLTGFNQQTNW